MITEEQSKTIIRHTVLSTEPLYHLRENKTLKETLDYLWKLQVSNDAVDTMNLTIELLRYLDADEWETEIQTPGTFSYEIFTAFRPMYLTIKKLHEEDELYDFRKDSTRELTPEETKAEIAKLQKEIDEVQTLVDVIDNNPATRLLKDLKQKQQKLIQK
jgi:hypothetical protein